MVVRRLYCVRSRLLARQSVNYLLKLVGMSRVELNHPACKESLAALVEHIDTAHAAAHNVVQHILATYGWIVGLAHKSAQELHFVIVQGIACAESVHRNLRYTLQYLVAVASDVELGAVLKVGAVVLKALFCGIAYGVEHQLHSRLHILLVALKARAVYPVQADVGAVGTCPLGRVASVGKHTLKDGSLKLLRHLLLSGAHLYEDDAERLRFGYLVEPPVLAVGVAVLPELQCLYDVVGKRLVAVVLVLFVDVGSSPVLQAFEMLLRRPVGDVVARIVDVVERALFGVVQLEPLLHIGVAACVFAYALHKGVEVVGSRYLQTAHEGEHQRQDMTQCQMDVFCHSRM